MSCNTREETNSALERILRQKLTSQVPTKVCISIGWQNIAEMKTRIKQLDEERKEGGGGIDDDDDSSEREQEIARLYKDIQKQRDGIAMVRIFC